MIEAAELTKRFGEVHAVNGVSFSIAKGEVVGLLGPNGAGKTTTMRMLTTYLPPTSGTAKVAGFDVQRQAKEVRSRIGYLPESPPLYPELRVREYLQFMAKLRGLSGREAKTKTEEIAERCGLSSVLSRICAELSKGYRQRVGLAQALVHSPEVIILDEPTSGLDPAQIIEMRKLISELRETHTVVLSTHILQEVAQTCQKVIIIANGRVVVEGDISELTKEQSLETRFLEAVSA